MGKYLKEMIALKKFFKVTAVIPIAVLTAAVSAACGSGPSEMTIRFYFTLRG